MNGLEWFAYAFLLPGVYIAGKMNKSYGWLLQFTGSILLVIFATIFSIWGIVFANSIFSILFIISYIKQKKLSLNDPSKTDEWGMIGKKIIDKDKYIQKCFISGLQKRPNIDKIIS